MTNKKEQIQSILNLMKSLDISIDDLAEKDLTEKKDFLTYEEAIDKADRVCDHEKGSYSYQINNKATLVENGVVLVRDADDLYVFGIGAYFYKLGKKWTIIHNGEVLITNADQVAWNGPGRYEYEINGEWFGVNINK